MNTAAIQSSKEIKTETDRQERHTSRQVRHKTASIHKDNTSDIQEGTEADRPTTETH